MSNVYWFFSLLLVGAIEGSVLWCRRRYRQAYDLQAFGRSTLIHLGVIAACSFAGIALSEGLGTADWTAIVGGLALWLVYGVYFTSRTIEALHALRK